MRGGEGGWVSPEGLTGRETGGDICIVPTATMALRSRNGHWPTWSVRVNTGDLGRLSEGEWVIFPVPASEIPLTLTPM